MTVTETGHEVAIIEHDAVASRDLVTLDLLDEMERIAGELVTLSAVEVTEGDPEWVPLTLSIENATDQTMDGAVAWEVPEGWQLEAGEPGYAIPPGARHEIEVATLNPGALYPVPELSMAYPLADGRTYDVELPLRIVRKVAAVAGEQGPPIDGDLSDGFWEQSSRVRKLYPGDGYSAVEGETEFLFGHDGVSLYVAAVCRDDTMVELQTSAGERDAAVYLEDCVGLFLQPNPEEMVVYQIYVSADGTVFDQRITFDENMWWTTDPSWNGEYQIATSRADDRWTAEIAIPFETLVADISANPTWKLNFRRKQQRTSATADWQVPIDYNPTTFGEIDFR